MNHTPTPWQIIPDYSQENIYRLWDVDGNFHDDTSPGTMDTNARLMEAAPELLAELKRTLMNAKAPQATDWETVVERITRTLNTIEKGA